MPKNLMGDSFPVLFEGLHTTAPLELCKKAGKKVLVRAHNIEHSYYRGLARSTKNLTQKLFFRWEAAKLLKYEKTIGRADHILSVARHEAAYFKKKYGNSIFIPAFHRFDEISCQPGSGNYILFHGDLSVPDNSETILDLSRRVLDRLPYQVVVAGKNPSMAFRRKIARFPNIRLVADPGDRELEDLIVQAHINLLLTRQATGIKLKLLHSLFAGRHCLVNPAMVEGSGLDELCIVAGSDMEMERHIHGLMQQSFDESELRRRKKALKDYSNRAGAEKILRLLS